MPREVEVEVDREGRGAQGTAPAASVANSPSDTPWRAVQRTLLRSVRNPRVMGSFLRAELVIDGVANGDSPSPLSPPHIACPVGLLP